MTSFLVGLCAGFAMVTAALLAMIAVIEFARFLVGRDDR